MSDMVGKEVVVFCANFIYTGTLVRETHDRICIEKPIIVFETGPMHENDWREKQAMPTPVLHIERSGVESMGLLDRTWAQSEAKRLKLK